MKNASYFFSVCFFVVLLNATVHAQSDTTVGPVLEIEVCYNKTSMLVFPASIREADYGSADIILRQTKKTSNILKVKAVKAFDIPTNISVITENGQLFSINVRYYSNPTRFSYPFTELDGQSVNTREATEQKLDTKNIERYARQIAFQKPMYGRPRLRKYDMQMAVQSIFIRENVLFFAFRINNTSHIPFDTHLIKFYQKDRRKAKRTSQMQKEMQPLFAYSTTSSIGANGSTVLVAAFDKFTIADNKFFMTEIFETNGDRNLALKFKGKRILRARPLLLP